MTLVTFLAVCAGGIGASLGASLRPRLGRAVGPLSLAAAAFAAWLLRPGETLSAGDIGFGVTWFAGLFLTLGLAGALGLCLISPVASLPRLFPAAAIATFALLAISLTAKQPAAALLAAAAAAAPILGVSIRVEAGAATVTAELRTLAILLLAALVGAVCLTGIAWTENAARVAPVAGYLLLALAIAIRSGSVPFHVPAARLSRDATPFALALALVWIPAGFATVALAWAHAAIPARTGSFDVAVAVVVALAVATLLLGALGALFHDDLREVAVYSIAQDSAFLLLALAIRDQSASDQSRLWLLAYLVGKTALIGWVVAMSRAYGTTSLESLGGWARRSPLLAAALVAIGLAAIGWPGFAVYEARAALIGHALAEPFRIAGAVATLLSLAVYSRVLGLGLTDATPAVAGARGDAPRLPVADLGGPAELPDPAASAAAQTDPTPTALRPRVAALIASASRSSRRTAAILAVNATPLRHAGVLGAVIVAAAVALGGFGAAQAAGSQWTLEAATAAPSVETRTPGPSAGPPSQPPAEIAPTSPEPAPSVPPPTPGPSGSPTPEPTQPEATPSSAPATPSAVPATPAPAASPS